MKRLTIYSLRYLLVLLTIVCSGCTYKDSSKFCASNYGRTPAVTIPQVKSFGSCFEDKQLRLHGYLRLEEGKPATYSLYDTIEAAKYGDLSKQLIVQLEQKHIDEFPSLLQDDMIIYVSIKGKFIAPYFIEDVTDIWYTDNTISLSNNP